MSIPPEIIASIDALNQQLGEVSQLAWNTAYGADVMWLILCATLIFSLQAGFALVEVGTVRTKNTVDILYKNILNGAITVICWWILGYGFAFGNTKGGFIGVSLYGLDSNQFDTADNSYLRFQAFFIQWAYAATAVTIVGGSLSERAKLQTYLIVAAAVAIWIYPIIVHWCWGQGWLSPHADQKSDYLFFGKSSNNYIDMAGSGVVHAVGGTAALIGAIALGARKGRFDANGNVVAFKKNSIPTVVLGTLILWIGWYGYNCGSTYSVNGRSGALAGKIAMVTTLATAFSAMTCIKYQFFAGAFDITQLANSVIAGLVGISAACSVVEPWGAMIIGIISCIVYLGASKAVLHFKIDDAIDAFAVHGACGIWGALAVGIFGSDTNAAFAGYNGSASGEHPFRTGEQFGVQLVGIICIVAWTFGWSALLFFGLQKTVGLRVEEQKEEAGDVELVSQA